MPTWKRLLLISTGLGGGFAFTLAIIMGVFEWYGSHPKPPPPWDSKAITAAFDARDGSTLYYILQNNTDRDYTLNDGRSVLWMDRLPGDQALERDEFYEPEYPIVIPTKQRVRLKVRRIIPPPPPGYTIIAPPKDMDISAGFIPKPKDFVLFDGTHRYQIDFPKGW